MKNIKGLVAIFAFSLLVSLPTVASAQWGGNNRNRDDDNYGRNNGYYGGQLKNTIKRLKNDSKDFERFLDRELDNSRLNGRDREDYLNKLADKFKDAANDLEDDFDSRNMNRTSRQAQNVINLANQLDRELRRVRLSYQVENYWNNIRRQVNEISNAYGYDNRNNRGRSNRSGDWRNRIPFPF